MVVDEAAEDATEHGARAVGDVADALEDASSPQRDEVRAEEGRDGHEPAAADAGYNAAEDDCGLRLREAADEIPGGEEDVAEDQARPAAKDVGQAAGDGLAGGIGDEVGRREPAQEAQGLELA